MPPGGFWEVLVVRALLFRVYIGALLLPNDYNRWGQEMPNQTKKTRLSKARRSTMGLNDYHHHYLEAYLTELATLRIRAMA